MRKNNVSIIFQDNNLLSDFTVLENIMMPLIIKGKKTFLAKKMSENLLKN